LLQFSKITRFPERRKTTKSINLTFMNTCIVIQL